MKVNSLGIQAYQQLNRNDKPTELKQARAEKEEAQKVLIEPKAVVEKSALAVKGPSGSYAKYLSNDERIALENLFDKFRDAARFGSGYQVDKDTADESKLVGTMLDVKV